MSRRKPGFRLLVIASTCFTLWTMVFFVSPSWPAEKEYPSRPITVVINLPPGSSIDVSMRIIQPLLLDSLKVPLVYESKVGGAGAVGADFVAKAKPDGYTVLASGASSLAIIPTINPGVTYKFSDFTSVGSFSADYIGLVARPDAPFKNLEELVNYAKQNPGKLNYGTAGKGSVSHVFLEVFKASYGLDIVPVHFAGGPPAKTALLGGHVELSGSSLGGLMSLIKAGNINLLVTAAPERLKEFPNVPTLAEKGFPRVVNVRSAVFAPVKCPKIVVDKLSNALGKAFSDPGVITKIEKAGLNPAYLDAEATRKLLEQEFNTVAEIWRKPGVGK